MRQLLRRFVSRLSKLRGPGRRRGGGRPGWFQRHPVATRRLALATVFGVGAGLGGVYGGFALVCRGGRCPSVEILDSYQPSQTSKLYAVDGRFIAELGLERRTLVSYDDIPAVVRNAFVSTEDKRFFSHGGIDFLRIPGSVLANLRAGSFAEGFSTITMQLARNVFPDQISRERSVSMGSLVRKLREARVALMIEGRYPKERILELYLNQINLGSGAFGVETASQRYFGKSVRDLTLAEAATLAAIPKAPTRYNPRRYPDRAIMRRNTIIELMRRQGAVEDEEASLAKAYPLQLAQRTESGDIAPYFVEFVRQQLEKKFGARLYDEGLRVFTTLDLDMQAAADRALETQLRTIEGGKYGKFPHTTFEQHLARGTTVGGDAAESPYLQGAFVAVEPRSGAVRAMIGGRDFDDSKFNRASQALRQPGSTFKPVVYATAIMQGRSPATIYDDAPIEMPQVDGSIWTPGNYDGTFGGPQTMRYGFAQSRNLVAIRAGMDVGEAAVIETARAMGLRTAIPRVPSIFIGSADVFPLQMVASYSTFATLGAYAEPNAILRVESPRGEVLWKPSGKSQEVMSPAEAWLMVDMLKGVVQRGTAAGSVWGAGFHVPSGGKTGTTNDGADVWYIGFTADLVAGVWMGFDKPKKIMANAQGGRLAAPAFTQFMLETYRRKPAPPDWPRPEQVVLGDACGPNGAFQEYFLAGTEGAGCSGANPFLIAPQRDTAVGRPAAAPATAPKAAPKKAETANPFKIPGT
ncbi:MAG: PBP1A family penicillin-binding protein [Gemmatimonadetes bacterium]|nr:PBP1A family penicillin-binding protein [Gemmatimonadota bacterium]